jgi:hypothetical protein
MARAQPSRAFLSVWHPVLPTERHGVDLQRCRGCLINPDGERGRNVEGFAPNACPTCSNPLSPRASNLLPNRTCHWQVSTSPTVAIFDRHVQRGSSVRSSTCSLSALAPASTRSRPRPWRSFPHVGSHVSNIIPGRRNPLISWTGLWIDDEASCQSLLKHNLFGDAPRIFSQPVLIHGRFRTYWSQPRRRR